MRSSSGQHYLALDHVRAVALYLVFCWHFCHGYLGSPVPFEFTPAILPLALLDEGHTGVSLFMTLSGYLFAKLLDGRRVTSFATFFWNRVLRLAPMLIVMFALLMALTARTRMEVAQQLATIVIGFVKPAWPNGGWSVAVELHFYLLLPALLWLMRKHVALPLLVLLAALAWRLHAWWQTGTVAEQAYWTIGGRIDQFILGMLAFRLGAPLAGRHALAGAAFLGLCVAMWRFDAEGGFRGLLASSVWVWWLTFEAASYATLIAWYDRSFTPRDAGVSRWLARLGAYSYSTYLLHFFFVFSAADFINQHVVSLANPYVAFAAATIVYLCTLPLGALCWFLIERPFVARRKPYAEPTTAA